MSFLSKFRKQSAKALIHSAKKSKSPRRKEEKEAKAKAIFARKLKDLLARPIPAKHQCRFCGHDIDLDHAKSLQSQCIFSGYELIRFVCCGCGGVFGPVQLIRCKSDELAGLYKALYRFYSEGFSTPYQEKTFYLMNPSILGQYINYACGDWSEGIRRLRELNWQIIGYEPFQKVKEPGIYSNESFDSSKDYDGLMSHNYIEHVQDPTLFFEKCCSLLKANGRMAHSSACFEYLYEVTPFHLFFYCGQSVEKLAKRTGFKVTSRHASDLDFPGHQYICYTFDRLR